MSSGSNILLRYNIGFNIFCISQKISKVRKPIVCCKILNKNLNLICRYIRHKGQQIMEIPGQIMPSVSFLQESEAGSV